MRFSIPRSLMSPDGGFSSIGRLYLCSCPSADAAGAQAAALGAAGGVAEGQGSAFGGAAAGGAAGDPEACRRLEATGPMMVVHTSERVIVVNTDLQIVTQIASVSPASARGLGRCGHQSTGTAHLSCRAAAATPTPHPSFLHHLPLLICFVHPFVLLFFFFFCKHPVFLHLFSACIAAPLLLSQFVQVRVFRSPSTCADVPLGVSLL